MRPRREWEEFIEKALLDLYQGQMKALDLIGTNDQHIKLLTENVSRLVAVIKDRDK